MPDDLLVSEYVAASWSLIIVSIWADKVSALLECTHLGPTAFVAFLLLLLEWCLTSHSHMFSEQTACVDSCIRRSGESTISGAGIFSNWMKEADGIWKLWVCCEQVLSYLRMDVSSFVSAFVLTIALLQNLLSNQNPSQRVCH